MASERQTNFRAGELSPFLWGRTDLPLFQSGLRRLRNFFVTKHGAASSRPGTTYVAGTKYYTSPDLGIRDVGQVRLIRFDAGDDLYDSYALEFGNNYIRFFTAGAQVLTAPNTPLEVATPYSNDELSQLQFAQVGDVLVLAHPNHPPQQLRRIGPTNWELTAVRFKAYEPFFSDVGTGTATVPFTLVLPRSWKANTAYALGAMVYNGDNVYECVKAGQSAGSGGPSGEGPDIADNTVHWRFLQPLSVPDAEHIAREWQWAVTMLVKDKTSGAIYETLPYVVNEQFDGKDYDGTAGALSNTIWPISPDMPIRLRRAETAGLISPPIGYDTYDVLEFLVYRGRGGLFGFIGSTKSREFIDVGDEPDVTTQPPDGVEPFNAQTGWPAAVAFFQQRLCFGGPASLPGDVFTSKTGDFANWCFRLYEHSAGEALHYQLAARRKQRIRSFGVLGRLIALTNSAAWSIGGVSGSPLDFDSVDMRVEDEVGATILEPLIVDAAMLYTRAKGRGVRALQPAGQDLAYQAVDVAAAAEHLFVGVDKDIIDWAYAEDPFGIVWAVRKDGQFLSLTFEREAAAWAHHDTSGVVESICAVPEGDEDAVYLVVVRTLGDGSKRRYIERMTSRFSRGGAVASSATEISVPADDICLDSAKQYFGAANISTITGLGHLEGRDVWVLAKGREPLGPFTVTAGAITLDPDDTLEANIDTVIGPRLLAYVGLAFTCELETLDIAAGSARMRQKTLSEVGLELTETRGVKVGMNFDDLDEVQLRDLDDGYVAVSNATALASLNVPSEYNRHCRLALRQELPLPVTVVGLTREVDAGE